MKTVYISGSSTIFISAGAVSIDVQIEQLTKDDNGLEVPDSRAVATTLTLTTSDWPQPSTYPSFSEWAQAEAVTVACQRGLLGAYVPDVVTPQQVVTSDPVPDSVPLWAFRFELTQLDTPIHDADVLALITYLPEPSKTEAQIQWVYGNYIDRVHPFIAFAAGQLGWTNDQVDALFVRAGKRK